MSDKSILQKVYLFRFASVIMLLLTNSVFAAFSAFVIITPENEANHPFLIQAQPMENQPNHTRIRVIGPVAGHKKVWLIVCKQSLLPTSQNFRTTIWEGRNNEDEIVNINQLNPGVITLPETGSQEYAYVEVILSSDEMQSSYLYIDYPHQVFDGGYYYSIDLAYYLEDPSGKKSQIQWEKH